MFKARLALFRLRLIAFNSDWLIALFAFVVTGWSYPFGFGFTTLCLEKPTLIQSMVYLDSVNNIHNNDLPFRCYWYSSGGLGRRSLSPPSLIPNVCKRSEKYKCVVHGDWSEQLKNLLTHRLQMNTSLRLKCRRKQSKCCKVRIGEYTSLRNGFDGIVRQLIGAF